MLRDFFSTSNKINENVVMMVVFSVALLVSTFIPVVDPQKYYILAGLVVSFGGIGALKK